jgi:hypothetical protein
LNINPLSKAHGIFINGVIDDFFQEDVDAIIVVITVISPSDVHANPSADVLHRGKRLNMMIAVGFWHRVVFYFIHRHATHNAGMMPIWMIGVYS